MKSLKRLRHSLVLIAFLALWAGTANCGSLMETFTVTGEVPGLCSVNSTLVSVWEMDERPDFAGIPANPGDKTSLEVVISCNGNPQILGAKNERWRLDLDRFSSGQGGPTRFCLPSESAEVCVSSLEKPLTVSVIY